jgi:hypothetical protein
MTKQMWHWQDSTTSGMGIKKETVKNSLFLRTLRGYFLLAAVLFLGPAFFLAAAFLGAAAFLAAAFLGAAFFAAAFLGAAFFAAAFLGAAFFAGAAFLAGAAFFAVAITVNLRVKQKRSMLYGKIAVGVRPRRSLFQLSLLISMSWYVSYGIPLYRQLRQKWCNPYPYLHYYRGGILYHAGVLLYYHSLRADHRRS